MRLYLGSKEEVEFGRRWVVRDTTWEENDSRSEISRGTKERLIGSERKEDHWTKAVTSQLFWKVLSVCEKGGVARKRRKPKR